MHALESIVLALTTLSSLLALARTVYQARRITYLESQLPGVRYSLRTVGGKNADG